MADCDYQAYVEQDGVIQSVSILAEDDRDAREQVRDRFPNGKLVRLKELIEREVPVEAPPERPRFHARIGPMGGLMTEYTRYADSAQKAYRIFQNIAAQHEGHVVESAWTADKRRIFPHTADSEVSTRYVASITYTDEHRDFDIGLGDCKTDDEALEYCRKYYPADKGNQIDKIVCVTERVSYAGDK